MNTNLSLFSSNFYPTLSVYWILIVPTLGHLKCLSANWRSAPFIFIFYFFWCVFYFAYLLLLYLQILPSVLLANLIFCYFHPVNFQVTYCKFHLRNYNSGLSYIFHVSTYVYIEYSYDICLMYLSFNSHICASSGLISRHDFSPHYGLYFSASSQAY